MTDPDLEIRVGGSGHPDPEIRGRAVYQNTFSAPWAPVWSKNRGGGALLPPPLDPPLECGREEKPDAKAVFCLFIVFKKQCHLPR